MQDQSSPEFNIAQKLLHPDDQRIGFQSDRPGMDELIHAVGARGWQIEWRAKRAGARRLFWARVLDQDGWEISACGGWYQTCERAICKALERPLLLLQSTRPATLQLWAKRAVIPAAPMTEGLPQASPASTWRPDLSAG